MNRSDLLKQVIQKAGEKIASMSPDVGVVEKEGKGNLVTAADLASEKIIAEAITKHFPNDIILSEETESQHTRNELEKAPHLWITDPIDRTYNFRHHQHYSCVSLGYLESGTTILGGAYNPFSDELFLAEKGKGASLNGAKIRIEEKISIEDASVATDHASFPENARKHLEMLLMIASTPRVYVKGSAVLAMCEVAMGRMDIYFNGHTHPWDNAAGHLIVQEAGGIVTNYKGKKTSVFDPEIIVGHKSLVDEFVKIISQ